MGKAARITVRTNSSFITEHSMLLKCALCLVARRGGYRTVPLVVSAGFTLTSGGTIAHFMNLFRREV